MWWIILVIGIAVYVIYLVNKDYKADIQSNVIESGGMQSKYKELITYFMRSSPSCKITILTNSHVAISDVNMKIWIDYVGGNTEIQVFGYHLIIGKYKNKWKFQKDYPQTKMILEIESYFDWLLTRNYQYFHPIEDNGLTQLIFNLTMTVEKFKEEAGINTIDVKENPNTGKLFMVDDAGNVIGAVASNIKDAGDLIDPVISLVNRPDEAGREDLEFPLLHNKSDLFIK